MLIFIGDQVTFRDCPTLVGQRGVVIYPGSHTSLVRCALASGRDARVHPLDVVRAA